MNKIVKFSAILAGVVVVLAVAAGAVLYSIVDTERVKSELADMVRDQTGRQLVFKGDVGISIFPWLGMELGPISLSNAPGFGDKPFAEIRSTDVKVKLLPLLSKDIQVKTLNIDGLSLNLERDKQGTGNWDDLTQGSKQHATGQTPPSSPSTKTSETPGLELAGLSVGSVHVSDANLNWNDAGKGQHASLSKMNLSTGPVAMGKPFTFKFSTNAEAAEPPVKGNLDLSGEADLSKDFKSPTLRNVILKLAADGKGLPQGHVDASIEGDILIDLNSNSLEILGMRLQAMGMKISGDVNVAQFDTEPVVRTTLKFNELNPKKIMQAFDLPPIETTDPLVLQKASGSIEATATTNSVTVKHLELKVDDTSLSGSASVFNFDKPSVLFDIKADSLNMDRYLPPDLQKTSGNGPSTTQSKTPPAPENKTGGKGLPKDELRALNMDGTLKVNSLIIYNLRLTDTNVTIKAKDGLIRITPFSAALYGGAIDTNLTADMRGNQTNTKLDLGLSNFMLGGFLKDLIGEEKVTGVTDLSVTLTSVGDDWKALSKTLTGNAKVALRDGIFKGFQILPKSVIKKAKETDPQGREVKVKKQQPYQDITANFTIKDGIVSTEDTALTADGLGAMGAGLIDLPNEQIDYRAIVDITALPKIPVTIRGHWADPSISLDTVAFLEQTAKGIINVPVNIGKGAGNVGKDLLKGIGSGIKDIFGGTKKQ